jgi:hypothetical protein
MLPDQKRKTWLLVLIAIIGFFGFPIVKGTFFNKEPDGHED